LRNFLAILVVLFAIVLGFLLLDGGSIQTPVKKLIVPDRIEGKGAEANSRGVQELAEGKNEPAVASLRTADQLEPGNPIIRRNLSIALGRVAVEGGKGEKEAFALLGESLTFWPENPESLDYMANLHFRNARYGQALEYAEKLRGIFPDRPDLDAFIKHLKERALRVKGMAAEEGDRFRLLYSGERKLEFEGEILTVLQTEIDALTVALGIFPEDPVDVLILTGDLGERSEPVYHFVTGLYDGQIRLYVGDGIGDRERFVETVRHEMVHALLHHISDDIPGWVHEGIAQKVGEEPSEERIRITRQYIREALAHGYGVDFESLDESFIIMGDEERSRAYATSLLFMDWLEKRFGEGFIPRFVSEIASGSEAFSAVGRVTGMSFEKIQGSFHEYLTGDF